MIERLTTERLDVLLESVVAVGTDIHCGLRELQERRKAGAETAKDESLRCHAVGESGEVCDGGRVTAPNPQFTRVCTSCGGSGYDAKKLAIALAATSKERDEFRDKATKFALEAAKLAGARAEAAKDAEAAYLEWWPTTRHPLSENSEWSWAAWLAAWSARQAEVDAAKNEAFTEAANGQKIINSLRDELAAVTKERELLRTQRNEAEDGITSRDKTIAELTAELSEAKNVLDMTISLGKNLEERAADLERELAAVEADYQRANSQAEMFAGIIERVGDAATKRAEAAEARVTNYELAEKAWSELHEQTLKERDAAEAKLAFLKTKGLTVGLMKTSDRPEPYLSYNIENGSELCDLKTMDKLIEAERKLEAAEANSHPHMCQMDHPKIGYSGDDERCPVCIERDKREAAEARVKELEAEVARKAVGDQRRTRRQSNGF